MHVQQSFGNDGSPLKVSYAKTKLKTQLNFSGGKDSTAMLLRLIELGCRPTQIVFADTLMEFPEMYEYIDKIEQVINQKIIRVKPNHTFLEWFFGTFTKGKMKGRMRGFPYVITPCWYQREAKDKPMRKLVENCDVVYIGYTKGEEDRIMDSDKFRYPLIEWGWTEEDCVAYLKKRGLLNPLYAKFKRLGCWCCPKQNKESLEILKKDYPSLWNILLQLEKLSPHGFNVKEKLKTV
jgi:3'-phosphoadenosine 5'-phosphosulfate sulfotransferase (PAPS reductase)/FAD synthetase